MIFRLKRNLENMLSLGKRNLFPSFIRRLLGIPFENGLDSFDIVYNSDTIIYVFKYLS